MPIKCQRRVEGRATRQRDLERLECLKAFCALKSDAPDAVSRARDLLTEVELFDTETIEIVDHLARSEGSEKDRIRTYLQRMRTIHPESGAPIVELMERLESPDSP